MNKKIYFAGSIRGGRADAELYKRLIKHIQRTDTVLTEHVGDPSLSVLESGRDEAIYSQDTAWIRECDLLIAECTTPSLGVGYELAYAESIGRPCFVFYNRTRGALSAMIKGDPYFKLFPYGDEDELFRLVGDLLEEETGG